MKHAAPLHILLLQDAKFPVVIAVQLTGFGPSISAPLDEPAVT